MKKKNIILELIKPKEEKIVRETIVGRKDEELKIYIDVTHKSKNTSAKIFGKAVLYENANLSFNGCIRVLKGVTGCNSFLSLKVLLMGEACKVDAFPALEIENNDVKCSHSVSISRPSEEEIFYLMSRGLDEKKAKNFIAEGFLRKEFI